MAVDEKGRLFAWGLAESGRLGIKTAGSYEVCTPTQIPKLAACVVTRVSCGRSSFACFSLPVVMLMPWVCRFAGRSVAPSRKATACGCGARISTGNAARAKQVERTYLSLSA
jgi:Regulator of chromosome condensation (RCC1) repeat